MNRLDYSWALEQVKEPPCKNCKHFRPEVTVGGMYDSFDDYTVCHSDDMHSDFSCFVRRDCKK